MKRLIKLIFVLILIIIILFIKILLSQDLSVPPKIDDFLFLKLKSNNDKKEYRFNVDYKNTKFRSIDLSETIEEENLVYEKIAPGTSGSFDILLNSNQDLKYRIEFHSINAKPANLKFKALNNGEILGESNSLEQLSDKLIGYINKDEEINITINWYWDYENEQDKENTDIQDTKDSQNIRDYRFNICTIGEIRN